MQLTDLTDSELVARLSTLCLEGHALTARIIVHLIEVEERRLDLRSACTSMFDFCQRRLGMSEGAAFRRINAARLVKRFPSLLARIETGELRLSTLVLVRTHLTDSNVDELAAAVAGKTQRQVEEILARLAPKPDVPSAIVELGAPSNDAHARLPVAAAPTRTRIEPLAEARYKVQLTAGADLKAKLERACELMRHRNPSGNLAPVLDAALDLLLARLEKERLAKVKTPKPAPATVTRRIPASVRREVFERDGEQCTFVGDNGERCPARGHLELDHLEARALGGGHETSNLRVRCRAHNNLYAEEVFGRAHIAARRADFRQRKSIAVASPTNVIEIAQRGLENMGFAKTAARCALVDVSQRHAANGEAPDAQLLLLGAIAALT